MPRYKRRRTTKKTKYFYFEGSDDSSANVSVSLSQEGKRLKKKRPNPTTALINLDSDEDSPSASGFSGLVQTKMNEFFKSSNLLSDDEDSTEVKVSEQKETPTPNTNNNKSIFELSDSEDEAPLNIRKFKDHEARLGIDEPSTSKADLLCTENDTNDNKKNEMNNSFIDSLLNDIPLEDSGTLNSQELYLNDMKSLEEYRKETEELLKSVSVSLDEFRGVAKETPKPPVEVVSPKKNDAACPVCLESFVNKPLAATICGHIFCKECITQAAKRFKKCPTCRKAINLKKIHPIYL